MLIISVADVKGVSQLIEPENASNNLVQRRVNSDLWMIMKRAPGYSLKEFIERKCQGVLEISAAIQLTLNLIGILQQVHNKGIFHQNLSPENIMIEWDSKSSIDRAQLTLLNFSQAVIISNRTYTSVTSLPQKWYRASQIDDKGLSSTVDSSDSCAVLFWLLTQIDPRHENGQLPHQQARDKLNDMIKSAVKSTSM
jgi:serine/threonine protein kinase